MHPVKSSARWAAPAAQPEAGDLRCDVCDGSAYESRCKIICRRCGYTRDCSDP